MSDFKIVKLIDPIVINMSGPKFTGEYSPIRTYTIGESVSYLGSSYVAMQSTLNNTPTDTMYWQLLAQKGSDASVTFPIRNETGANIPILSAVYIIGANLDKPTVSLAKANAENTSSHTLGLTITDISNNADGFALESGILTNVNTSAFTTGDLLWLSPLVAGEITNIKPIQPYHSVFIGHVLRSDSVLGSVFVSVKNGYQLNELHDVLIVDALDSQILRFDTTSLLWKNHTLTKTDIGLSNVQNLDQTNPANIVQTSFYRFVTDTEKSVWNGKQDALGFIPENVANKSINLVSPNDVKYPTTLAVSTGLATKFNNPTGTTAQYIAGDGSLITFPTFLSASRLVSTVENLTGAVIPKGSIVYINGAHGNRPTVALAQANTEATSSKSFGMTIAAIGIGAIGTVSNSGEVSDLDTFAYNEGDAVWLSPTTPGGLTLTKPVAPNHNVFIGIVTRKHPTQGVIDVKIQNGYELNELHNVLINGTLANNDTLVYDSTALVWKNSNVLDTKENIANKSINLVSPNNVKYPTTLAVSTGLATKFNNPTGTTAQYILGNGTLATFLTAVLGSVLTGLSLVTSTAVVAADTILVAIGKLQAQLDSTNATVVPANTGTSNQAGSSAAHAKADHIHNTVILNYSATASNTINTNSTAYVTMTNTAITTPAAGTYLAMYTVSTSNSSGGETNTSAIHIDGAIVTNSLVSVITGSNNQRLTQAFTGIITLNGTQSLDIRWRVSNNQGSAYSRSLVLIRMS